MSQEWMKTALHFMTAFSAVSYSFYVLNWPAVDFLQSSSHPFAAQISEFLSCGPFGASDIIFHTTVPVFLYWITAFVMMILDAYFDLHNMLQRVKINEFNFKPKIVHTLYRKAIWLMFFNTFLSWASHFFFFHPLMRWRGEELICGSSWGAMFYPSKHLGILALRLLGVYLLTDVVFYTTHRICHEIPFLYKKIHKVHHQWVETYGIDASAAHPVEQFFVNMATVEVPALIMGIPMHLHTIWLCIATFNTVCSHSGYNIVGYRHDVHHHYPNCEFGINIFCDRLLGTGYEVRYDHKKKA